MTSVSGRTYLPEGLPAPAISPDALDAPYWEGAKAHRLVVQSCTACGQVQWPPEEICAACHAFALRWIAAEGSATIASWSRIWHPVHPALQGHGPYLVVVVTLTDHPVAMVGNLLGDPLQPVEIGERVRVVFEDQPSRNVTLVQWQRIQS
jgi:uncharacterized OB-fold protein